MHELERRVQQRFSLQFPIFIEGIPGAESRSLTRDVSARGVFFYTHAGWLQPSTQISFSMILPAEITGTKAARVVCKGTVVRLEPAAQNGTGVAATIDSYDF
ncbi:MAG: PilZ domain-containing protein [Terriglobales bacterium]